MVVLKGGLGDVLSHLVDGAALVDTTVLLVAVKDVEDDDAEVVEGAEAVAAGQFLVVVVPLDGQVRVVDGREARLKVGALTLDQAGDVSQLRGELGRLLDGRLRRRRRTGLLLEGADLGQRVGLQRVEVDAALAGAAQRRLGKVLTELVAGFADVLARVVTLHVSNVQHDESKVGHGLDARRVAQRLAVVEPLDFQVGITDRHQSAFEVGRVAVFESVQSADLRRELRLLAARQVHTLQCHADLGRSPLVGGSVYLFLKKSSIL